METYYVLVKNYELMCKYNALRKKSLKFRQNLRTNKEFCNKEICSLTQMWNLSQKKEV
jgi:hypothetical protein